MAFFLDFLRSFSPTQDGFLFMWGLALLGATAFIIAFERWRNLVRCADVDAPAFAREIARLVGEGRLAEAHNLCLAGERRALPQILGAGIGRAISTGRDPGLAMRERFLGLVPAMDKRIDLVLAFGNVATLLGLMGTIYGLILSFSAVSGPGVAAVEKSALLASGISAAMNTTLFGLIISIPCVIVYTMLRSGVDTLVGEIDRYTISLLKIIDPGHRVTPEDRISLWRIKGGEDTEPNIGPMMSLIVILIPLLLTSAEFIKVGSIELKLPDASAQEEKLAEPAAAALTLGLNLSVTAKGFNLSHHFRTESGGEETDIPLVDGRYDFGRLQKELAEIKRRALYERLARKYSDLPADATLVQLYSTYARNLKELEEVKDFADMESIQISAENAVKYQTLVSTMDAARELRIPEGKLTLFPNVSLAMGVSE